MRNSVVLIQRWVRPWITNALLAAALIVIAAPGSANEVAPEARNIDVEGNRRIDADTVRSYFHAAPDGRFDAAALDTALKALLATGLFNKVTFDHAGERLEAQLLRQVAELALGPAARDLAALEGSDAGAVIAAIFEPFQRIDQARRNRCGTDDPNNPAHQAFPFADCLAAFLASAFSRSFGA